MDKVMKKKINESIEQIFKEKKKKNFNIGSKIDLSLIFFSDNQHDLKNRYDLLMQLAEFGDQEQFEAIWLPERHYHPFGGMYPNPAILASAIAMKTSQIRLRAGSVVLPLHHPTEVVEQWSMVDNLSSGRVDLGFASGWNPNDFITKPSSYKDRKQLWMDYIPIVEKLWRGETINYQNGLGKQSEIRVYPKPKQSELDVWLVITKNDESFRNAGERGYNILTMLQGIEMNELARKISLYRNARKDNGHCPDKGKVTLMLHTFLGKNKDLVEQLVRDPFHEYIASALNGHIQSMKETERPSDVEVNKMVEYSYNRYFKTGALFGGVDEALSVVEAAVDAGVNEIACLLDFGVNAQAILKSLPSLRDFKKSVDHIYRITGENNV